MNLDVWYWKLIAAIGIYIGGILTKPLSELISQGFELRNLRRALYSEIAYTLDYLAVAIKSINDDNCENDYFAAFINDTKYLPCYEHAIKNPIFLARIKDISGIRCFYANIESFRIANINGQSQKLYFSLIVEGIRVLIRDNKLNKRLLSKYVRKIGMEFIRSISNANNLQRT
jgi:hypothetical protein